MWEFFYNMSMARARGHLFVPKVFLAVVIITLYQGPHVIFTVVVVVLKSSI